MSTYEVHYQIISTYHPSIPRQKNKKAMSLNFGRSKSLPRFENSSWSFICMNCMPVFVVWRVCFSSYKCMRLATSYIPLKKLQNADYIYYTAAPYLDFSLLLIKVHLLFQKLGLQFFIRDTVFMNDCLFLCNHISFIFRLINCKTDHNLVLTISKILGAIGSVGQLNDTFLSPKTSFGAEALPWAATFLEVDFV